ncbi:ABC transporter substrate-binding protein, partial [Chloroflexota bacterium]
SKAYTLHITHDRLLVGDWAKGPSGTAETDFLLGLNTRGHHTGCVVESWELVDPDNITFKIRKGIHFHDKPPVNGRELTAEDVAFTIERAWSGIVPVSYLAKSYTDWFESVTCPDKWTVKLKVNGNAKAGTQRLFELLALELHVVPPESIEEYGDQRDWRNSLGTGAYMLTDYVEDSSCTLKRNPNYWMKDPLHPENQLPYPDGVKWLIIKDPSTQMAALRTRKIHYMCDVGGEDTTMLLKSNPELQSVSFQRETGGNIYFRVQEPELPYYDVRVRRALHMAIDFQAIKDDYYNGQADILCYPVSKSLPKSYVPIEELPESSRELFSYNPDKAKQLLAEAGYPDGFNCSIVTRGGTWWIDQLSIVAEYWAKIGVNLELDVKEEAVYLSIENSRSQKDLFFNDHIIKNNEQVYMASHHGRNYGFVADPIIDECYKKLWAWENMENAALQAEMLREIHLSLLDQAWVLQLPTPNLYTLWMPWIQNYHGEYSIGGYGYYNFVNYIWIDQDLKEAITGRR